jgi:hypothetical protein
MLTFLRERALLPAARPPLRQGPAGRWMLPM